MSRVTIGGEMIGVAGIRTCDTCGWAEIHEGRRTIVKGNVTIIQNGGHNIDCKNTGSKDMDFRSGEMKCSGWKSRG